MRKVLKGIAFTAIVALGFVLPALANDNGGEEGFSLCSIAPWMCSTTTGAGGTGHGGATTQSGAGGTGHGGSGGGTRGTGG
ncbi:MAG: hypothetical protein CMB80_08770 [Flammeovirgaceae bacterium]|nr:hypothetical protein [Flammeovirgaceae bacterium]